LIRFGINRFDRLSHSNHQKHSFLNLFPNNTFADPPVCSHKQPQVIAIGAADQQLPAMYCNVDAVPSTNLAFHWLLKTTDSDKGASIRSVGVRQDSHHRQVHVFHSPEQPSHLLKKLQLLCWADNELGAQRQPCLFNVLRAGQFTFNLEPLR
jgi:hypothetical protein